MILVTNHGHDHGGDEDNDEKRVLGDFGQACDLDDFNDEGG